MNLKKLKIEIIQVRKQNQKKKKKKIVIIKSIKEILL
jgi:hypothetical protein